MACSAADLVAIAGTDAAQRGADRLAAGACLFKQAIFLEMPGENDVGPVADHEVSAHVDAAGDQAVDFVQQAGRIEDHAGGDDALDLGAEDAAGDERQFEGLAAGDDGMAGIGPALVADDDIVLLGEQIDDLALGLVAPLQSDNTGGRHRNDPR